MVVDVLGYQSIDFPDSTDPSRRITGFNIFYGEPIRERGKGTAYVKKFVPTDRVIGLPDLGPAEFNIQLSMSGKPYVESFFMVPADPKSVKQS